MKAQVACLPSREYLTLGLLQRMSAENVLVGQFCIAPQRVPSRMKTWVPTAVTSTTMHTVIGFRPLLSLPSQSLFLRTTLQKNRPGHEAWGN